jgi:DNA-binding transcriptional ArsR family regulator
MRDLGRTVGISLSGISHHLRVLEKQGVIVGVSDRHYRRYFLASLVLPAEARQLNEDDRTILTECRRPASLAVILTLAAEGPMTVGELGKRLEKSRGTVSYHLSRLVNSNLVRAVAGQSGQTYGLSDPVRVVAVLATFAPSLGDHTDRFARLWLALRG